MEYDDRPEQAKRLQTARERRGFKTAKDAARYYSWTYETYIQHEQGTRGLSRAAGNYAKAFRVSEGWLLTGEGEIEARGTVPIVGYAGAGPDGTVLFATGDGNFGEVDAPINATATTEALEVRGDSMRDIAHDGSLLFYDDKSTPGPEHIDNLCICWLPDDRVLVKYPYYGRGPGLWTLESTSAPTLRDVQVDAMALVINVVPRVAAKKLIRRRADLKVEDVVVHKK